MKVLIVDDDKLSQKRYWSLLWTGKSNGFEVVGDVQNREKRPLNFSEIIRWILYLPI